MGIFARFFGPPSRDKFARLMTNAIRQAGETAAIVYDAGEFRLVVEGEGKRFFNLGNIYHEYCSLPQAKRREGLRHYVRSWFSDRKEIPGAFEDLGPDLLPAVRDRSYFETTKLRAELDGLAPVEWPSQVIAEHLAVSLVYDLPEALVQVQQRHLSEWGCSFEDALAAACENLRENSRHQWESPFRGVWVSPWRDNHDTARLLLTDLVHEQEVDGHPVAMVPNRDTLIVTGSEHESGLREMARLAEKGLEHPRAISGLAFLLDGETWLPWLPEVDHPLHDEFKLLRLKSLGQDYAEQKDCLEAQQQKSGADIFVASYSALRNDQTGKANSYCVWSQGVDTLLPKADEVFFFVPAGDKGEVVGKVNWDRVQQAAGELMEAQGMYPERYRVRRFPTAEQLAAMRKE